VFVFVSAQFTLRPEGHVISAISGDSQSHVARTRVQQAQDEAQEEADRALEMHWWLLAASSRRRLAIAMLCR
jgi:hypothetical protein